VKLDSVTPEVGGDVYAEENRLIELGMQEQDSELSVSRSASGSKSSIRNNRHIKKKYLGLCTQISAIWNVNASDSTFDCDLMLNMSYFDELVKKLAEEDPEFFHKGRYLDFNDETLGDFTSRPIPKLLNDVDVEINPSSYYILDPKLGLVSFNLRIKGTFRETQEVDSFPFDTQDVSIRIRFSSSYILQNHHYERTHWFGYAASTEFLFKLLPDGSPEIEDEFYFFESEGSGRKYPVYAISVELQRRWPYYAWNIMLFIFILTALGSSVFMGDAAKDAIIDREALVLGIFLTFAAFKFVISDKIPKVSYLTTLDKYLLLAITLSTAAGAESMLACHYEDPAIDDWAMIIYWATFAVGHLFILADIIIANRRVSAKRRWEKQERLGMSQFNLLEENGEAVVEHEKAA